MRSLHTIRAFNRIILLLILFSHAGIAQQQKEALEKQRARLQQQIFDTQELLRNTQQEQKNTLLGLQAIQQQVRNREKLVHTLSLEVTELNGKLRGEERKKGQLENKITTLRETYSHTLQRAYLVKKVQHPMMYILSAESINQGFRRWAYLRQLDRYQKNQLKILSAARDSLEVVVRQIETTKADKSGLLAIQQEQQEEIRQELRSLERVIGKLKSKEKDLRSTLRKKKSESARLNAEIERLIAAEMNRNSATGDLPDAPAMIALSKEFASNAGKLPWPVRKGIITGKFGDQPHPVIKSIKIRNNGVDISSEQGAPVQAVFGGKVVGIKEIPGFDRMLIIRHGNYYSVYSKLKEIFVEKDDAVETGQSIGSLSASGSEPFSTLHFEIWEGKTQLNPESWLAR